MIQCCVRSPARRIDSTASHPQASLLTANFKLADPCTFRIIVRTTSVLLDKDDQLKQRMYATLDELIRSYQRLDDALLQAGEWDSETRDQVDPLLANTIKLQEQLKDDITECIALPA